MLPVEWSVPQLISVGLGAARTAALLPKRGAPRTVRAALQEAAALAAGPAPDDDAAGGEEAEGEALLRLARRSAVRRFLAAALWRADGARRAEIAGALAELGHAVTTRYTAPNCTHSL